MAERIGRWIAAVFVCTLMLVFSVGCDELINTFFDYMTTELDTASSDASDADTRFDFITGVPFVGGLPSLGEGDYIGGVPTGGGTGEIQSGTLTAGSFDDNLNFDVFKQYVSNLLQADSENRLANISIAKRIIITVQNDSDEVIGGARVVVSADDDIFLDTLSGSDGRIIYLPVADGGSGLETLTLSVYPLDGGDAVVTQQSVDDDEWTLELPGETSALPTQLDLAFLIDATGSMTDELEYLKVEVQDMVSAVEELYPDVDQKYSLIVYRDYGDDYVTRVFDFTGSLDTFQTNLSAQRASGGGDYEEAVQEGMADAAALTWRTANTARILFWIADAPPHTADFQATIDSVMDLRQQGVALYPIAASGAADEAEFIMRISAFATGSQYLFLTDDSGVGNEHAEPHIPCYWVETLKKAMMRMILIELSGEQVYPAEEDIIRTVGTPPGPCVLESDGVAD